MQKSLGLKPNGAKLDIILQVKNAISKDEAKFQKAFRKMWGWSGGWVSGMSMFERKRKIWLMGLIDSNICCRNYMVHEAFRLSVG